MLNNIYLSITILLLVFNSTNVFSQYYGGNADGHSKNRNESYVASCGLPTYSNINLGGNADGHSKNLNESYVASCGLPTYSNISLGGNADGSKLDTSGCVAGGALPIELLSFDAYLMSDKTVRCEWETATEINNDYFTVETSPGPSKGGVMEWEIVGIVDGAGNSNSILYYQLIDYSPPLERGKGWAYYRLKQTDFNGNYSYSDLVAINLEGIDIINLSPNPAEDEIAVLLYSTEKTKINVNIFNVLGQKVIEQQQVAVAEGTNKMILEVSSFSTGYYLLEVETVSGLYRIQKKLIKN